MRAPGLRALEAAFKRRDDVEVWVVAPDRGRSACSHGLTLARPVFVKEFEPRHFGVDGTPADCVYLALFGLMDARPDVVVSGINHGANLGGDVIYSGTVAGAREAALRGVHGVAASLVEGEDFDAVAEHVVEMALQVAPLNGQNAYVLNLNYPAAQFKGVRWGRLGTRSYPEIVTSRQSPGRGFNYYWLGGPPVKDAQVPQSDGWLIGHGHASATLLTWDQTNDALMKNAEGLMPFISFPAELNDE